MARPRITRKKEEIRLELARRLGRAGAIAVKELKTVLSVPAPRIKSKTTGKIRAATPATPGAPPRKLTGRLRASVAYVVSVPALTVRIGTNVVYGRHLELRKLKKYRHPWLMPTLRKLRPKLRAALRDLRVS